MSTLLQYIEFSIAIISFGYGIFEFYKRKKLEQVLKTITQTYPGDVAKLEQSCVWAWANISNAFEEGLKLPESSEKSNILRSLNKATGDSVASARLCHTLFNQLLGFQQAQFNTRTIIHQEKNSLDLCKLEANGSK
jgi:hypothetical protein